MSPASRTYKDESRSIEKKKKKKRIIKKFLSFPYPSCVGARASAHTGPQSISYILEDPWVPTGEDVEHREGRMKGSVSERARKRRTERSRIERSIKVAQKVGKRRKEGGTERDRESWSHGRKGCVIRVPDEGTDPEKGVG